MLFWYGTFGQTANLDLLNDKRRQYPGQMTAARYDYAKRYHIGTNKRVYDCAGLIKSYWMQPNPNAPPVYSKAHDKSADGLYRVCDRRGAIKSLPEEAGALVFMARADGTMHHAGLYLGGGRVIEARGFDYGVVVTSLSGRPWSHWGKLPESWLSCEAGVPKPGSRVRVKRTAEYYPGQPMSAWVQGQVFTVGKTQLPNGQPAYFGGLRCVTLAEISSWCAVIHLEPA